jgi:hypothetical protein
MSSLWFGPRAETDPMASLCATDKWLPQGYRVQSWSECNQAAHCDIVAGGPYPVHVVRVSNIRKKHGVTVDVRGVVATAPPLHLAEFATQAGLSVDWSGSGSLASAPLELRGPPITHLRTGAQNIRVEVTVSPSTRIDRGTVEITVNLL